MVDSYETTRALFSRIKTLDPVHATKIMGYVLIQDQGEDEMLRLALGPDSLLLSLISTAKSHLGISSNTSSALTLPPISSPSAATAASTAPFSSPVGYPFAGSRPAPLSLSETFADGGSGGEFGFNPRSPSYAAVVNGSAVSSPRRNLDSFGDPVNGTAKRVDLFEESVMGQGMMVVSPIGVLERNNGPHFHRRSYSVNDAWCGTDDWGYKQPQQPCVHFMKGFCKNGSSCRFVHGGGGGGADEFAESGDVYGSATGSGGSGGCNLGEYEEEMMMMMRCKVAQQQQQRRMAAAAAQFMSRMNCLQTEAQRSAAMAAMMDGEFRKLNRCSSVGRSEFSGMGGGDANPASTQIYLTFPADSTFREEDVSNYFSMYGPVQDVRIPYQQKRMFGFVTFVYPETVKIVLAKGNPHFVCDSRVLVKPYKEKTRMLDKKQQQHQLDRSEFSSCSSPSGHNCMEPFDIQIGPRAMYNTPEMLRRRKLEQQADLQQALELQERRLMNLQLMDMKSHYQPFHNMSAVSPILSPHHGVLHPSNGFGKDNFEDEKGSSAATPDGQLQEEVNAASIDDTGNTRKDESNNDECDLPESLDHVLPDNLFGSPTKSAGRPSIFRPSTSDIDGVIDTSLIPAASSPSKTPLKSCFSEMPRFASGHGTAGM